MEKISINKSVRENKVKEIAIECLTLIIKNAEMGLSTTGLYIEKEISVEVRDEIERKLKESKTEYEFLIISREINKSTGKVQIFTSETIGDEKYYKIKIL